MSATSGVKWSAVFKAISHWQLVVETPVRVCSQGVHSSTSVSQSAVWLQVIYQVLDTVIMMMMMIVFTSQLVSKAVLNEVDRQRQVVHCSLRLTCSSQVITDDSTLTDRQTHRDTETRHIERERQRHTGSSSCCLWSRSVVISCHFSYHCAVTWTFTGRSGIGHGIGTQHDLALEQPWLTTHPQVNIVRCVVASHTPILCQLVVVLALCDFLEMLHRLHITYRYRDISVYIQLSRACVFTLKLASH